MKFYNTLTRQKEEFKPIKAGEVGLYTCGPTVYNFPHLGNLRTYLFTDILKRTLNYNGLKVKHVMNITDVGHLTGDRDMGEDKMEREAKLENKSAWAIAEYYTNAFKSDLKNLNIIPAEILCKATDHLKEQIDMVKVLEAKGFTYKISDGIYFDTSKVSDYTKLSHQNIEALKEGARVEINPEKRNLTDFALWKFSPTIGEKRQMEWNSPWGVGFPGWHIECSAMAVKYLGEHFDIHCGGIDHIDVHHTNEIAQTESATGKKNWVNIWMHGAFLNIIGGKRMAKSSGNFITLNNTFIDKKINPLVYRLATLNVHYRKPMEWSEEILISAKNGLENLYKKVLNLNTEIGKIDQEFKQNFIKAINDDLNMAKALAITQEVLKSNLSNADKLATILDFDQVLGLNLESLFQQKNEVVVDEKIQKLITERELARQNKDWKKADELRKIITSFGFKIEDK